MIGFITDCEGDYGYWSRCVSLSQVVEFDFEGGLPSRGKKPRIPSFSVAMFSTRATGTCESQSSS